MIDDANVLLLKYNAILLKYLFSSFAIFNIQKKYIYMQETVNERIRLIAERLYKNNVNELCRALGIKQATMSNIVAGRMSKPSFEVLAAIIEKSSVSAEWLITGEGEMLKSSTPKEESAPITNERLLSIIESQQRTIENLSKK